MNVFFLRGNVLLALDCFHFSNKIKITTVQPLKFILVLRTLCMCHYYICVKFECNFKYFFLKFRGLVLLVKTHFCTRTSSCVKQEHSSKSHPALFFSDASFSIFNLLQLLENVSEKNIVV